MTEMKWVPGMELDSESEMGCAVCKWMTEEPSIWEPGVDRLCHYEPKRIMVSPSWWCRHFAVRGTEDS